MNKLGIIIQARTGSTRLPSKMILPFYGNDGILSILLSRLTQCKLADSIIVATTSSSPDDAICDLVREHRVKCFRGDENDVLDRFIQAARYYGISKIIRICADNPFLDIESLDSLILASENIDADYVSFCTSNHTPTIKTHFGFWAEYEHPPLLGGDRYGRRVRKLPIDTRVRSEGKKADGGHKGGRIRSRLRPDRRSA